MSHQKWIAMWKHTAGGNGLAFPRIVTLVVLVPSIYGSDVYCFSYRWHVASDHQQIQCWLLSMGMNASGHFASEPLTLLVLKIEYPRITNSVIWLLMHWLFSSFSSGRQHPWFWIWHINVSLFITRKDFEYQQYLIVIQMMENSNFNICSSNIKSLWPSEPILWQRTAPSHCLNP